MFSLIHVFLIINVFPTQCASFDKRCPYPSEWKIRERVVCTSNLAKSYYCLYDDNKNQFTEMCRVEPNTAARGYKIGYSGGFELQKCSDTRYQPFGFVTEGNSDCVYIKSMCRDEGLVAVGHREPTTDKKCSCDYTQGYSFVAIPVNKCHCIPSHEDCTCYKQLCNESSILSPDYTCAKPNEFNYKQMCSSLSTGSTDQKEVNSSKPTVFDDNKFERNVISAIAVLVMIIMICLEIIVFIISQPTSKMERTIYRSSEGGEVEIICIIDSFWPVRLVTWRKTLKNGQSIDLKNDTSQRTVMQGYNSLKLKTVNKEDSGIYSCLIATIYGNYKFSAEVIIEDVPVLQTILLFNNTMRITSSVPSREKQFIIQTVSWKKSTETSNTAALCSGSKYDICHEYPSLIIRNLNKDDVGTYLCEINNSEDLTCRIAIGMSDIVLHTTDPVDRAMRITCIVPSTERPFTIEHVAWKKITENHESAAIKTDSKYVMQRDPPSLLIRNIDTNDAGKYVCCISGNSEERICSIIIVSPKITCELSQVCALPGEEIKLEYFIASDFPVETKFKKINEEAEFDILLTEVTHKSLSHVSKIASSADAGMYTCIVSNALGKDTASRILIIRDDAETAQSSVIEENIADITMKTLNYSKTKFNTELLLIKEGTVDEAIHRFFITIPRNKDEDAEFLSNLGSEINRIVGSKYNNLDLWIFDQSQNKSLKFASGDGRNVVIIDIVGKKMQVMCNKDTWSWIQLYLKNKFNTELLEWLRIKEGTPDEAIHRFLMIIPKGAEEDFILMDLRSGIYSIVGSQFDNLELWILVRRQNKLLKFVSGNGSNVVMIEIEGKKMRIICDKNVLKRNQVI